MVVFLQNCVDLLRDEHGSCSELCLTSSRGGNEITSIKVEKVTDIREEENRESVTPEVLKMQPDVSVLVFTFNKYPELLASLIVCIHETVCGEWILNSPCNDLSHLYRVIHKSLRDF